MDETRGKSTSAKRDRVLGKKVKRARRRSLGLPIVGMTGLVVTDVKPEVRDGKVYVDLGEVDKGSLVQFKIENQPVTLPNGSSFDYLPVTAFVAPSARWWRPYRSASPAAEPRFT